MKKRMLQCLAAAVIGCTSLVGSLHAEDFKPVFGSEDDTMPHLPPDALAAVRAHARTTEYKDCADGDFVGSAVDLSGHGQARDWIAKTADGCAWGASSVTIWVLKREPTGYRVVLFSGGQTVGLRRAPTGASPELEIVSATAGSYAQTIYKFNGKVYKESASRFVDLTDPAACKRNRDVCGHN
jgi:hypothetical protein